MFQIIQFVRIIPQQCFFFFSLKKILTFFSQYSYIKVNRAKLIIGMEYKVNIKNSDIKRQKQIIKNQINIILFQRNNIY